MSRSLDALIIGAGPAGIAAALRLAGAGRTVLVLEGADFAGAENWSGCVYHGDPLLRPDVLGPERWAKAPLERQITRRRLLFHDDTAGAGFDIRAVAGNDYGEAWTVLRPRIDRYLAACAIDAGALLLPRTTATGLWWERGRVVGALTDRGRVRAPAVFLAEGDASGLIAREGFEQTKAPHFAQGIMALYALGADEIDRRFGLVPNEGLAEEWILAEPSENVPERATGFLYTNRHSLSVGLALPLARVAHLARPDHALLLQRLLSLPGMASRLAGARRVAYGVKVIRSGGLAETPRWSAPGLAVGGAGLGLGQEFPYPNFIGPALTTGIAFADALIAGGPDELPWRYEEALAHTPDYANAHTMRHWARAFDHAPALWGRVARFAGALARDERPIAPWPPVLLVLGLLPSFMGRATKVPPLAVSAFARDASGHDRALAFPAAGAQALGAFYGRREPILSRRLGQVRHSLLRALWPLAIAWLATFLPRRRARGLPSHRPTAAMSPHQALTWIAPIDRPLPDRRHLSLGPHLPSAAKPVLARVCPAEVYLADDGLAAHFENCIKCESCRVSVTGLDWNRRSGHRLIYVVPHSRREGLDGSSVGPPDLVLTGSPTPAPSRLHHLLAGRGLYPLTAEVADYHKAAATLGGERSDEVRRWLREGHYGWAEAELAPDPVPDPAPPAPVRRAPWFARLRALAGRDPGTAWADGLAIVARQLTPHARLPAHAVALAWTDRDGLLSWVPADARVLVDPSGAVLTATGPALAEGGGFDPVKPVRRAPPQAMANFQATLPLAELVLALASGITDQLCARALDYARTRVQFEALPPDQEQRRTIAKFGAIKAHLARLAAAQALLDAALRADILPPESVLHLVIALMNGSLMSVPWCAGQIFGGLAYSEEDELAPRYRDALQMTAWLGSFPFDPHKARRYADDLASEDECLREALDIVLPLAPRAPVVAPIPLGRRSLRRFKPRPHPYHSGAFAWGILEDPESLLMPEHFREDPALRALACECLRFIRTAFSAPIGTRYDQWIDRTHQIPAADVDALRAFGAFATLVPRPQGGRGWSKPAYMILTRALMGHVDTSVALLVMASTSIGTTPVLLSRDQDLPRYRRALAAFDQGTNAILRESLAHFLAARSPITRRLALWRLIRELRHTGLLGHSPVRYLARPFLTSLATIAATHQPAQVTAELHEGLELLLARVERERQELGYREEALERFLSGLGRGDISAFALTEPTAGSDTGALATRAARREVAVQPTDVPGLYQFDVGRGPRLLLDARALERRDGHEGLPTRHGFCLLARDERRRFVLSIRGERRVIDDIGLLWRGAQGLCYRYYEVTGSKMWITNGSIADRLCVYVQTEEGETGLMVTLPAEGFSAGAPERKLGQRASPTNELRFDQVRVDVSNILGIPGHGQVNALETLSVGRGGIVAGCATLLERLMHRFGEVIGRDPVALTEARGEWIRLETLAARLVGLTDTVTGGDFRIEAALSKFLASEGLHRVLLLAEQAVGPDAARRGGPLEKWRRDARILNIYEGTNEVQRFLVLKDLPALARAHWRVTGPLAPALRRFWRIVRPAVTRLGPRLWMEPDLQLRWFPVVDWLAELYVLAALTERARALGRGADQGALAAAFALTHTRLNAAARDVEVALARTAAGLPDLAEQVRRLAQRLLDRPAAQAPFALPDSVPVTVIVRARYSPDDAPRATGLCPDDLATLDAVMSAQVPRAIRVLVIAPAGLEDHLKRLMATGVELHWLEDPDDRASPEVITDTLKRCWPDTVLVGVGASATPLARVIASHLGARFLANPESIAARRRGLRASKVARPCVAAQRAIVFTIDRPATGRSDLFTPQAWARAISEPLARTAVPEQGGHTWVPRPPPSIPADPPPRQFGAPEDLAHWLCARYQRPPSRLVSWTPAHDPLPTHWVLVHSDALVPDVTPAFRAALDRGEPFAILAVSDRPTELVAAAAYAHPLVRALVTWPLEVNASALVTGLSAGIDVLYATDALLEPALAIAKALHLPVTLGIAAATPLGWRRRSRGGESEGDFTRGLCLVEPDYRSMREVPAGGSTLPWRPLCSGPTSAPRVTLQDNRPELLIDIGRGISDTSHYTQWVLPLIDRLAHATGARVTLGATRKVIQELNLLSPDRQIGQTGRHVHPDLVLALGVSGAPQHWVGLDGDAPVVAINRDAAAPIFAHTSRVVACHGPLEEWLPRLIEALPPAHPHPH